MTTLSQLLAIPSLDLRLVQSAPTDPELNWVSATSLLDLAPYLEGGEVILTSGHTLGFDDRRWLDFVANLSRAQAAAIGFGVGIAHDRIPPQLIRAASIYQVALFEIPARTPFMAVSKAAAALLRADELNATRNALGATQRLLNTSPGGQEPAAVLATVAQVTGRQLAIVGSDGSTIASTGGFTHDNSDALNERINLDTDGALQLIVTGGEALGPSGHAVIAAGALVLGLGLRSEQADANREREQWERLTTGLLDGTYAPASAMILAPEFSMPQQIRAIAVQGAAEDIATWRRITRTGVDRLIAPDQAAHTESSGLGLAWQLCPDTEPALSHALASAVAYGLDAVVGRPAQVTDAGASQRSARAQLTSLSLTAPLYSRPRTPAVVWADRETPVLEALLSTPDASSALSARVLGPLSLHASADSGVIAAAVPGNSDGRALSLEERDTLRATLTELILAAGQRGPAAAALGIHRNTLRERINRVERLTARSLASADDRAELWLALRIETLAG